MTCDAILIGIFLGLTLIATTLTYRSINERIDNKEQNKPPLEKRKKIV